jgi:hypothetical protein
VGLLKFCGNKYTGEWHQDKQHGIGKIDWNNGNIYWGQFKNGISEGYGAFIWAFGEVY